MGIVKFVIKKIEDHSEPYYYLHLFKGDSVFPYSSEEWADLHSVFMRIQYLSLPKDANKPSFMDWCKNFKESGCRL